MSKVDAVDSLKIKIILFFLKYKNVVLTSYVNLFLVKYLFILKKESLTASFASEFLNQFFYHKE